ncbi:uncharacterized protein LACBIDRAFT_310938 [Laccaria bicolor S238N-H82]|uniref:Predicted protein n=1 Tax=Laccaria bicolor (strain S238N-H82 / ATCC MYA-4686) TaxID=486041 RepID=B0E4Y1_LACBS|nr:uncharacterized protein LACBIDRAFT_310938 [Laccaria bicolor S238N-H82]EDQ98099.1 predicted protein [Laccaria bicolor S238N-H82]|eukprot:XP_001891249.1 predicted protein [Laccaria bicolor S238N-H82]
MGEREYATIWGAQWLRWQSFTWLGSARSQVRSPTCGKQFRHHVHSTPPGDAEMGQVYGKVTRSVV